ncbi:beta-1,3-galactosyltransferase pvg3-like [Elaeis guineensis]|uniref:Hexosyltransferase n=1 Tax=Elaeis guineensis var. tenera TaxID=51953 RepID=A0A6I9QRW0_ELAGV|nr:beta-1,3-galactosyltransferase pvg3-like [Elaeis guineensis]
MKRSCTKPSHTTISLILIPLTLLAFICLFLHPKDFDLRCLVSACNPSRSPSADFTHAVTPQPDFRLLIGILTLPDLYERRHLLRLVYSLQPKHPRAHIDIRFVFCNLTKEEQRVLVALEIMRYNDIIILNCTENMNSGKTYTYFSTLPKLCDGTHGHDRPYDYVMKADDDSYLILDNLAESLRNKSRVDMYYGCVLPCDSMDPFHDYMSGMGYILSWDLVEWISTSEIARKHTVGVEDLVTAKWLRDGNKAKNRYTGKPAMYDHPDTQPRTSCQHEFVPDTVLVHKVKSNLKWATMLKYFNATHGLQPSKFYHLT